MLLLLACAHHPPADEACAAGDLAACHLAAEALPDPTLAWQLERFACEGGHGPACMVSGDRYAALGVVHEARPDGAVGAALDYARACGLGIPEGCVKGAALPDDPSGRAEIGAAALRACRAEDETACGRLTTWGWRNDVVAGVRRARTMTPLAVLSGGTVLGLVGDDIVADGPGGPFQAPLLSAAVPTLDALHVTMDGRVLTRAPDMIWSVLDGRAYAARAWPAAGDVSAFTPDGGIFAETVANSPLLSWWDLRRGNAGAAIDLGEPSTSVSLSPDGRWIAAAGARAVLADRVTEKVVAKLPCAAPIQFAPDGEQLYCRGTNGIVVASRAGKVVRNLPAPPASPFALAPDGTLVAVARSPGVVLLDAATGEVRAEVTLPPVGSPHLAWSPDGGRLMVWGPDGVLVVTRKGARDDGATDKAIVQALRGPPDRPEGGLSLREDGVITGTVTVGGQPARGAVVSALPCTPGPGAPPATRADLQGKYTLSRLARGCWSVRATVGDAVATTTATARAQPATADLALAGALTVEGRLRLPNGRPAADVHIALSKPGGPTMGVTDAKGKFSLTSTTEATELVAWTEDTWTRAPLTGEALDLKLDRPHAAVHVRIGAAPGSPEDLVVNGYGDAFSFPEEGGRVLVGAAEGTRMTLRAERAKPALAGTSVEAIATPGASIEVPGVGQGTIEVRVAQRQREDLIVVDGAECAPTADGCVTGRLPAGKYRVRVHRSNHQVGEETVAVRAGEEAVVAPILGGEVLRGRVVDATTGAPLAGVRVTVDCVPGLVPTAAGVTGVDGYFKLAGALAGGGHHLRVNTLAAGGFAALEKTIEVTGSPDLGELRLPRAPEPAPSGAVSRLADALKNAGDPLSVPELAKLLVAADGGDAAARATVAAVWQAIAPPPDPKGR